MKKWKAILFGTLLTLSLCTFTACGTEVNNADETVDEKDKNTKDKEKDFKSISPFSTHRASGKSGCKLFVVSGGSYYEAG